MENTCIRLKFLTEIQERSESERRDGVSTVLKDIMTHAVT